MCVRGRGCPWTFLNSLCREQFCRGSFLHCVSVFLLPLITTCMICGADRRVASKAIIVRPSTREGRSIVNRRQDAGTSQQTQTRTNDDDAAAIGSGHARALNTHSRHSQAITGNRQDSGSLHGRRSHRFRSPASLVSHHRSHHVQI